MSSYQNITISVTDDHTLFRKGLISLIQTLGSNYEVVFEAANGNDFIDKLQQCKQVPQLAIMDINMPGKNGFETVAWLNENYPKIHVLVISMVNKEETIVRMLKMGVKGYLSKDVEPEILQIAIDFPYYKKAFTIPILLLVAYCMVYKKIQYLSNRTMI